jgi:transposase InsO family protein
VSRSPLTFVDDYNRSIIAWKLCAMMKAKDVTDTLEPALEGGHMDMRHDASKPVSALSHRPRNHLWSSP